MDWQKNFCYHNYQVDAQTLILFAMPPLNLRDTQFPISLNKILILFWNWKQLETVGGKNQHNLYQAKIIQLTAFVWCCIAVDMKSAKLGEVFEGQPRTGKADCTLTIADEHVLPLVTGKLNHQQVQINHCVCSCHK